MGVSSVYKWALDTSSSPGDYLIYFPFSRYILSLPLGPLGGALLVDVCRD
jgi:hypothetical protein